MNKQKWLMLIAVLGLLAFTAGLLDRLKRHQAPNRAWTRGSPKRSAEMRWPVGESVGHAAVRRVSGGAWRNARCSLKHCLTWECLNSTCRLGATP